MQILNYTPGQKVTIFLETFDSQGLHADGYALPVVDRIIFPDFSLSSNFPQFMTKLDSGLYYFQFTLPVNADAVGSYLVDVTYWDPVTALQKQTAYQIAVNAPYGNFTITPSV